MLIMNLNVNLVITDHFSLKNDILLTKKQYIELNMFKFLLTSSETKIKVISVAVKKITKY